jgi:hypothetical protein
MNKIKLALPAVVLMCFFILVTVGSAQTGSENMSGSSMDKGMESMAGDTMEKNMK